MTFPSGTINVPTFKTLDPTATITSSLITPTTVTLSLSTTNIPNSVFVNFYTSSPTAIPTPTPIGNTNVGGLNNGFKLSRLPNGTQVNIYAVFLDGTTINNPVLALPQFSINTPLPTATISINTTDYTATLNLDSTNLDSSINVNIYKGLSTVITTTTVGNFSATIVGLTKGTFYNDYCAIFYDSPNPNTLQILNKSISFTTTKPTAIFDFGIIDYKSGTAQIKATFNDIQDTSKSISFYDITESSPPGVFLSTSTISSIHTSFSPSPSSIDKIKTTTRKIHVKSTDYSTIDQDLDLSYASITVATPISFTQVTTTVETSEPTGTTFTFVDTASVPATITGNIPGNLTLPWKNSPYNLLANSSTGKIKNIPVTFTLPQPSISFTADSTTPATFTTISVIISKQNIPATGTTFTFVDQALPPASITLSTPDSSGRTTLTLPWKSSQYNLVAVATNSGLPGRSVSSSPTSISLATPSATVVPDPQSITTNSVNFQISNSNLPPNTTLSIRIYNSDSTLICTSSTFSSIKLGGLTAAINYPSGTFKFDIYDTNNTYILGQLITSDITTLAMPTFTVTSISDTTIILSSSSTEQTVFYQNSNQTGQLTSTVPVSGSVYTINKPSPHIQTIYAAISGITDVIQISLYYATITTGTVTNNSALLSISDTNISDNIQVVFTAPLNTSPLLTTTVGGLKSSSSQPALNNLNVAHSYTIQALFQISTTLTLTTNFTFTTTATPTTTVPCTGKWCQNWTSTTTYHLDDIVQCTNDTAYYICITDSYNLDTHPNEISEAAVNSWSICKNYKPPNPSPSPSPSGGGGGGGVNPALVGGIVGGVVGGAAIGFGAAYYFLKSLKNKGISPVSGFTEISTQEEVSVHNTLPRNMRNNPFYVGSEHPPNLTRIQLLQMEAGLPFSAIVRVRPVTSPGNRTPSSASIASQSGPGEPDPEPFQIETLGENVDPPASGSGNRPPSSRPSTVSSDSRASNIPRSSSEPPRISGAIGSAQVPSITNPPRLRVVAPVNVVSIDVARQIAADKAYANERLAIGQLGVVWRDNAAFSGAVGSC